jgi:hypothetical protein
MAHMPGKPCRALWRLYLACYRCNPAPFEQELVMGINIFLVIGKSMLPELPAIVDEVNRIYGGEEDGSEESISAMFDWCDLFHGEGGHLLTFDEALAFPEDAQPWAIIQHLSPDGDWNSISTNPAISGHVWKRELTKLVSDEHQVVFLKARN